MSKKSGGLGLGSSSSSSSSSSSGAFGAPRPLAGQQGSQQSASAQLELENRMMEEKLKALQDKLSQQKLEDDAAKEKAGGVRWKASRGDKGSLGNFGKEISEKYKSEEGVDPVAKALLLRQQKLMQQQQQQQQQQNSFASFASSNSSNNRENMNMMQKPIATSNNEVTDFRSKDVNIWTTNDVSQWLNTVGLTQYVDSFVSNEISGNLLLDLSLEDLDYMSITILGHRKTIMRGIEDLRKNKRVTFTASDIKASPAASANLLSQSQKSIPSMIQSGNNNNNNNNNNNSSSNSMGVSVSSSVDFEDLPSSKTSKADEKKKLHWSQLEPISKREVTGGSLHGNSADESDIFDEDKERELFQQAVMEWRKQNSSANESGGGSSNISKDSSPHTSQSPNKSTVVIEREYLKPADSSSGQWKNPFAAAPSNNNNYELYDNSVNYNNNNLADGEFDEEAEHREFAKAVAAWRSGGASATSSSSSSTASESAGTSTQPHHQQQQQSLKGGSKRVSGETGKNLAALLAEELDKASQQSIESLNKQKEDMRIQLEEAKLMQQLSSNNNKAAASDLNISDFDLCDDADPASDDKGKVTATVSLSSNSSSGAKMSDSHSSHKSDDKQTPKASPIKRDGDYSPSFPSATSSPYKHNVVVSLAESRLGAVDDPSAEREYFVEEVDSD